MTTKDNMKDKKDKDKDYLELVIKDLRQCADDPRESQAERFRAQGAIDALEELQRTLQRAP